MIFNAVSILFLLLVFTGIGLLFPWSLYLKERRFESLLMCFWIGWAAAIAFLQLWHFLFPVGLGAFLVLFALSAGGWALRRNAVAEMLRCWDRRQAVILGGLALIPCGMVANHVLFNAPNSDYALYHLQTVKWISEYAIVPGLGNLFNPLALNCSSFLYTAAIDSGLLEGRAFYVSNSLLAYAAMLYCAAGLYSLFHRREARNAHLFNALMIPFVLLQVGTAYIVAYSPDPIVFFFQVVLAGEVLRLFEDERDPDTFRRRAAQIALLAAVGISLKLSFAVFGAVTMLFMAAVGIRRFQTWPWRSPRLWLSWVGIVAVIIVPWMVRSVILSGYLAFPNTLVSFPVEWKVPEDLALEQQPVIRIWAQTVDASIEYTGDAAWLVRWWNTFPFNLRQGFYFTLILAAFSIFLLAVLRRRARPDPGIAALVVICAASLVFWFFMAPSFRLSGAIFWILLAAAAMFAFRLLTSAGVVTRPDLAAYALVLVFSLWLSPNHFSNNLSRRLMIMPVPEQARSEQALSRSNYRQMVTNHGLMVNVPPVGTEECWDTPLPCTTPANFSQRLYLLNPGSLQNGIALDWD